MRYRTQVLNFVCVPSQFRIKIGSGQLGLTYAYNKNKIKKISNSLREQNEKNKSDNGVAPLPIYEEGQSLTALKVVPSAGIDPVTGQEIFIKRDGAYTFVYDSK